MPVFVIPVVSLPVFVIRAITLKVNVLLYPYECTPVRFANNCLENADDQRWSHPLDMLDDPESSCTDILMEAQFVPTATCL
jgi:hypothetical protein